MKVSVHENFQIYGNMLEEGDNKRSTYIQKVKDGSTTTSKLSTYIHVANLNDYLVQIPQYRGTTQVQY